MKIFAELIRTLELYFQHCPEEKKEMLDLYIRIVNVLGKMLHCILMMLPGQALLKHVQNLRIEIALIFPY